MLEISRIDLKCEW